MKIFMKRMWQIVVLVFIIAVILGGIGGAIFGIYKAGGHFNREIVYTPVEVDNSDEQYAAKIDGLKDEVVGKLRKCESAGYKEDDGLIVFDTNKKASVGTLQWQVESVKYYEKALYSKVVTSKEALLIALDDKLAGELAKDTMFKTKNMASKDWYNCAVRLNLDDQIAIIKKLEAN